MSSGRKATGAAAHRTPEQRLDDQAKMWRAIARDPKVTQKQLAVKLGISQQMVSRDYNAVKDQFLERRNESVELWLTKMIAGYDLQIEEAWTEFERSRARQGWFQTDSRKAHRGPYSRCALFRSYHQMP